VGRRDADALPGRAPAATVARASAAVRFEKAS
jgi:hypothetical protein